MQSAGNRGTNFLFRDQIFINNLLMCFQVLQFIFHISKSFSPEILSHTVLKGMCKMLCLVELNNKILLFETLVVFLTV